MTAALLSGRELAATIRTATSARVSSLKTSGVHVALAVVVATDDESTAWYVRSLSKAAERVGIRSELCSLAATASPAEITLRLRALTARDDVHGVLIQTPLPAGCRLAELASAVPVEKDVDGANPASLGRLAAGLPAHSPATAAAVVALLEDHGISANGAHAVIVGRSTVVGKPLAQLLLARDATVTVCHSKTADLAGHTRGADILIAAAGQPGLITAEHVRDGAVVIDVGTNSTADGTLVGDVDPQVASRAAALSPVPGGVGPVTTALLLQQVVDAAAASGSVSTRSV
jgi:methylenetetrahydrofolate dehydrogenase (NADP+)/methenyltetrahydrofolate cyclohydrolase